MHTTPVAEEEEEEEQQGLRLISCPEKAAITASLLQFFLLLAPEAIAESSFVLPLSPLMITAIGFLFPNLLSLFLSFSLYVLHVSCLSAYYGRPLYFCCFSWVSFFIFGCFIKIFFNFLAVVENFVAAKIKTFSPI